MAKKYKLPFKMRVVLLILKLIRGKAINKMSLARIQRMRRPMPSFFALYWILGRPAKVYSTLDQMIPVRDAEIPIRIYRPSQAKNLPIILNFHGGGWAVGTLQNNDHYCSNLAARVQALVISVDYRMAPENKFPVPVNDAYDALLWAHANAESLGADPSRIGVTGDSAGGNLSAAISLMARDMDGPKIRFQALIYPATDGTYSYESYTIHTNAPILTQEDLHFYEENYKDKEDDHLNPYFSPFLAEHHRDLPPALVITAGLDPLLDDGRRYATTLKEAGNEAEWLNFEAEPHGFVTFAGCNKGAKIAIDRVVKSFQKAFV